MENERVRLHTSFSKEVKGKLIAFLESEKRNISDDRQLCDDILHKVELSSGNNTLVRVWTDNAAGYYHTQHKIKMAILDKYIKTVKETLLNLETDNG